MQKFAKIKHAVISLTVLVMLFSISVPIADNTVSAADATGLTVKYGDTVYKHYTASELRDIARNIEGDKKYNFSTYNTYPTYKKENDVKGATVEMLISMAGITISAIQDEHLIIFEDPGSYIVSLTMKQLTEPRYYFPNGRTGTSEGKKGGSEARKDKVTVPAIIALDCSDNGLLFGQREPNEQTNPGWNKYVAEGGSITVTTQSAQKLENVIISPKRTTLPWGSVITLSHNLSESAKIYYTTDGSEPTIASDIYNYKTFLPLANRVINVSATSGEFQVRAVVVKPGFLDSDISQASYPNIPNSVTGLKASASNYKTVRVSWAAKGGADGYNVYYGTSPNSKFTKLTTTNTYVNFASLKTGTTYYYKVAAYKGNKEGVHSATVSAKPSLKKPTGLKAKAKGKKKIVITAKKVAGATGYTVYRSTKKKSGFKSVKTVKKSSLKYTDKKVKKGKKYYYKVKAYRMVSGKKVYSAFSSTVSRKAK